MKKTNAASVHEPQKSRRPNAQSDNPRVSALSRFADLTWDFSEEITNPTYTRYSKLIQWDFDVTEGERFSDPKYVSLMLACKQLFYAMLWQPERNSKFKANTITHRWLYLRHFVIFLACRTHPILRFRDVTRHVVDDYIETLSLPNKRGKKRTKAVLYYYYIIPKTLYIYRHKITDSIQFDPFDGESPSTVLGLTRRDGAPYSKTALIPDDVLVKLITSALGYVNYYSDPLIKAATIIEGIRQENRGKHSTTIGWHLRRGLKDATSHLVASEHASFDISSLKGTEIAKHLIRLRTACFILVAFLTGMRISELLSLEAGCVKTEHTEDGEFIWVQSSLHKTLGGGEKLSAKWLCGPVAAKAISALEQLTSKLRRTTNYRRLFIPVTKWGAHTCSGESVGATDMNERLKDYVKWLDLRDEKGNLFRLHAHMFRRTFARHVVRSDTTNLLALKEHFKHASLAMTDYYVGVDEELQDLLNDEANRLSFESFDKALRSDRLGGIRGKELVRQVNTAIADGRIPHEFRGEAGSHLRREMIAEWVAAGQQIYPCGAGNDCWFRAESAVCTEGERPVVEVCNPVGCANSVIRAEHDPHWRFIKERAEGLLQLNPPGRPYKQRLHKIISVAKKVRQDIA